VVSTGSGRVRDVSQLYAPYGTITRHLRPPARPDRKRPTPGVARTLRAPRWPRVLVAGLILLILGVTLVPSESRPGVIVLGLLLVLQAAARGLVRLPSGQDRGRGYVSGVPAGHTLIAQSAPRRIQ
jgi:hypothetical protein